MNVLITDSQLPLSLLVCVCGCLAVLNCRAATVTVQTGKTLTLTTNFPILFYAKKYPPVFTTYSTTKQTTIKV